MADQNSEAGKVNVGQQVLADFVSAWERGERPKLEEYLSQIPADSRPEVFPELINADLIHRRKTGEHPEPGEYIDRFPGEHPTISAAFDAISADTLGDPSAPGLGSTEVALAVGQTFGKYEIQSVLGIGGMGVVFGAYDTVIRRDVAIKLLSSKHSTDGTALSRLLQEAQTAGALHHPNIVGIYDVLEEEGSFFVVMEKVNGDNLSEVLKKSERGYLDWKLATRIVMDCCDALEAAHRRGMIHRDIKPQNIMLTVESTAKLLDFGLAKSDQTGDTALTHEGAILGTPDFMSPEQCSAGDITKLSDIYSLGGTFYALLTGQPPFASQGSHLKVMFAHCNQPVPEIERNDIPPRCQAIVQRAMAKRPEERFQSAQEFKAELAAVLSDETSPQQATPSSTEPTTRPKKSRMPFWAALAMAILAIPAISLMLDFGEDLPELFDTDTAANTSPNPNASVPPYRGVMPDTIHLGTTTAFNGANEELGRSMVIGMKTYFSSINDQGGVHGRRIELTVLDDRYDPTKALENMEELFDLREAFAVIGNVGTPTAKVTSKYASDHRYLFFAPFTGASLLRKDPPDRYIFNFRASYEDETAAMVKYFVESLRVSPEKIAVFAQNDSYGDDGFEGVSHAMRSYGVEAEKLLRVGYDRNHLDIDDAVATVLDDQHAIEAVVMVPTYKVAARFVKRVRSAQPDMKFGAVSFVGSRALAEEFFELGSHYAEGVIVTQVVPPFMSNATGVIEYRGLLKKYYPEYEPGFVSLEGFIAAAVLVEGLRRAGPVLTTESLIDALHEIKDLDLGMGPIISFGPSRHQASHRVWGTVLNANAEFEELDLAP